MSDRNETPNGNDYALVERFNVRRSRGVEETFWLFARTAEEAIAIAKSGLAEPDSAEDYETDKIYSDYAPVTGDRDEVVATPAETLVSANRNAQHAQRPSLQVVH